MQLAILGNAKAICNAKKGKHKSHSIRSRSPHQTELVQQKLMAKRKATPIQSIARACRPQDRNASTSHRIHRLPSVRPMAWRLGTPWCKTQASYASQATASTYFAS